MSDDLREALAKISPGDEVTVAVECEAHTGTVNGKAWLNRPGCLLVAHIVLRHSNGDPSFFVTAVLDHKPRVPEVTAEVLDALPVWAVVTDKDGDAWPKCENGLWDGDVTSARLAQWGPLTIRSRGGAA